MTQLAIYVVCTGAGIESSITLHLQLHYTKKAEAVKTDSHRRESVDCVLGTAEAEGEGAAAAPDSQPTGETYADNAHDVHVYSYVRFFQ